MMHCYHCYKITCKPTTGLIQERMKKLQDSTVSDNVVLRILANIGLGNHGILVAQVLLYIKLAFKLLHSSYDCNFIPSQGTGAYNQGERGGGVIYMLPS